MEVTTCRNKRQDYILGGGDSGRGVISVSDVTAPKYTSIKNHFF